MPRRAIKATEFVQVNPKVSTSYARPGAGGELEAINLVWWLPGLRDWALIEFEWFCVFCFSFCLGLRFLERGSLFCLQQQEVPEEPRT